MSVRFIIGRAGSGKTYHCLQAIRRGLQQDAIDGPRLIFLVPEQASMQMERAILQLPDDEAGGDRSSGNAMMVAHRAEVLSFQRLAYRVLDSAGGPLRVALTEHARAMVIRHLLAQHAGQLKYYGRAARTGSAGARVGGLVEKLGATVAELIQEAIAPEQLTSAMDGEPKATASDAETSVSFAVALDDPVQGARLHDLQLIYRSYLTYLGNERLDPSQHLEVARAMISGCDWLDGAQIWVDGFASLSGQETLTLVELAQRAAHVEVSVMMDPTLHGGGHSVSAGTAGLFAKTSRTFRDLRNRFLRAGIEVEEPLVLDGRGRRFQRNAALADLERDWWKREAPPTSDAADPAESDVSVELVELPSQRVEVDYAVSRICQWVQDTSNEYRYRDIAIIVRDFEPYHDLLSEALTARRIPFFIDRRRPVTHHPLIELLRSGLALVVDEFSLESVRLLLKSGLLPLDSHASDELENYLLLSGISGPEHWCGDDWTFPTRKMMPQRRKVENDQREREALERINAARRTFLAAVDPWVSSAIRGAALSGSAWASAMLDWLNTLQAGRTLKSWAQEADVAGDPDQAEEHRQVWRHVVSFLDDLGFAFSDTMLSVTELVDVVEAGLSGLTLGLVPPTVDQVLVGSIGRSRHPDIKAAVVLGFNDGVFPSKPTEDSILNDDDRALLQQAGLELRPGTRELVLDESMLVYVALTRASESLVVTYSASDRQGAVLHPSPYVEALRAACPTLKQQVVDDPVRHRATWDIQTQRDLVQRLTLEFRTRPARVLDDQQGRGRWNELYDTVRGRLGEQSSTSRAMRSLNERRAARLSTETIERLYRGPLRCSVSQLETYAACPFQHFSKYTLRLQERGEAVLDPVDIGHVHHAVLEDFLGAISQSGRGLGELAEGELLDGLRSSCTRVGRQLPSGAALSDARNAYVLRRSAADLSRVIRAQRRTATAGRARPKAAELPFGFDEHGSLPALTLDTPAGRRVYLRGYIDRVDLAELTDEVLGVVVDYKRTRDKRLDLSKTYHGLSLQLLAYLLALAESGRTLAGRSIRPVAALYVSLAAQLTCVDHPDEVTDRTLARGGAFAPRGLIRGSDLDALDQTLSKGWSEHYAVFRNSQGGFGHVDRSDVAEGDAFDGMLDWTRMMLGQWADHILDGKVSVSPYRLGTFSPCGWCPMASVCRFETGISDVRFLETFRRSVIFQKIAAGAESVPDGADNEA